MKRERAEPQHTIPPITKQELNETINQLKRGSKAADTRSQRRDDQTLTQPPPNWRDTTIKVLHKSGDPSSFSNYRPICSIPIMHKLFSQLFFKRLQPTLDASQCDDQDGATPRRTTYSRSSSSGREPLWVAAIDFKKEHDTVEHSSVWTSLRERSIEEPCIQLVTKLHDQQRASVHTDVKSKHFHFDREPSRVTHSARSCSTHSCNTS